MARILLKNVNAQGEFCGSENSFLRLYTQKLKPLLKPNHIRSFLLGAKPNDNEIEIGAKPFMLLLARQQGLVADDPQNFTNFFVNEVYSELEKYGAISICSALKYLLASNNCKAILQILVERNPEEFLRFYDALKSLMVRELDDENPSTQRIRIAQDRETLRQFWLSRDLKNKNFAKVLFVNNPERFFEIYRNEIRPVFLENNSLGKIWQLLMLTDKNEISDIADGASIFTLIFQNTPQFFIPFYENEIDASDCPPALKADLLRQFDLISSAIPQTVMSLFHLAAHNPTGFVRFFAKYVRSYLDAQTLESIFTPNLESEFVPLIIAKSNPKDFHEFLKSDIKDIIGDEALKEIYLNSKKLYEGEPILLALSHDPLVFQRALEDLTILAQKNIFKYSDILGFNKGDEDCVKRAQLLMTSSLPQAQKLRDEFDRQLQQDQLAADSAIVLNQVQQLQIGDESAAKRP